MNLANGAGGVVAVHVRALAVASAVSLEGPSEAHLTISLLWDLDIMTSQERANRGVATRGKAGGEAFVSCKIGSSHCIGC